MKNFSPYDIVHIDLSEQKIFVPTAVENIGIYTVLWWKEIALGDFYIEPNERFSENEYQKKIATAILSVIELYARKIGLDFDWKHFFEVNKIQNWTKEIKPLFSFEDSKEKPEIVPVSVVICTHNRPSSLRNCLNELRKLTCLPHEIIVVDNAPGNGETKEVVEQFPEATYVAEPRKGLDFARNTGISKAKCPIVAFTDDDVLIHPSWLYRVWETFQDDSATAAMTGLVIVTSLDTEARFIFEKHWSFNQGYLDKTFDKAYFASSKAPAVWQVGAGANMAFRKSIFDEVGYFHELLGAGAAGCSDDSEMWFRILAKGKTIQYNPRAIVYHQHRKTIDELKKQIFNYMRGFTTAALWQQRQIPELKYKHLLFLYLPIHYIKLLVKGFPAYNERHKTLWVEIKGIASGLKFFYDKKNRSFFAIKKQ
jgi:glycosyltransferase involved in cell wall biosynthesis